jgi:hypothetical protein
MAIQICIRHRIRDSKECIGSIWECTFCGRDFCLLTYRPAGYFNENNKPWPAWVRIWGETDEGVNTLRHCEKDKNDDLTDSLCEGKVVLKASQQLIIPCNPPVTCLDEPNIKPEQWATYHGFTSMEEYNRRVKTWEPPKQYALAEMQKTEDTPNKQKYSCFGVFSYTVLCDDSGREFENIYVTVGNIYYFDYSDISLTEKEMRSKLKETLDVVGTRCVLVVAFIDESQIGVYERKNKPSQRNKINRRVLVLEKYPP